MLRLEAINKAYNSNGDRFFALKDINITIPKGQFICFLGPSGCGKSTLINLIAGLEMPTSGQVIFREKPVTAPGSDRVVMFQESALFPWLNVIENIEFGLKMSGVNKQERREKALNYLEMMNLQEFSEAWIHELSGGMRQRVALARALTLPAEILLMDEPFAALDVQTKRMLQDELLRIFEETKKTIIFITHSVEEAIYLGERIIIMQPRPGRIKEEMTIHLPKPRQRESLQFVNLAFRINEKIGA
ncbi:ABC transporter ATP-binding protein [Sporomusa sphaeroides]|uniref:ABC transporter ATP-binding protein n=1 Tax=Sporomusa sphaeroides TaxID=47679 RepID=UPI003158AF5F